MTLIEVEYLTKSGVYGKKCYVNPANIISIQCDGSECEWHLYLIGGGIFILTENEAKRLINLLSGGAS